jgi:predicted Zn finger-like uncharacterized protein
MAVSMVISCPECKKKFKGKEGLEGKTVRCPSCKHSFVVQGMAQDKGDATKTPAAPAPGMKTRKVEWTEEDENSNPYGITDLDITPRCPYCTKPMESAKAVICLHCGYNTMTREMGLVKKTIAHSKQEHFLWLLPGLLCAFGIFLLINANIYICLYVPELLDRDSWVVMFDHESIRLWSVIFSLFIMWAMGFFTYRRLVLHPMPPEKVKD